MKDTSVLITSCNGPTSPGQIDCLRNIKERNIQIIGVDMKRDGAGSRFVDKFYLVPSGGSEGYVDAIFDICKENKVDVIIVTNDLEFDLSKEKERFEAINTIIAINDYETMINSSDKGNFLNFLKENNFPCAEHKIPKNIKEFEEYCYSLGYPKKAVVFRPRKSRGNRGFRIIQSEVNEKDLLLKHKPGSPYITLESVKKILDDDEFPDIVLMEYLSGTEYSVDVLAKDGEPLIMVPKLRIQFAPGNSIVGQVDLNEDVMKSVEDICRLFKFNYNVNIQLILTEDGEVYPFEINPRIAASIAACRPAGANLVYYGVKLALGEEIPKVIVRDKLKMIRYLKEYYEHGDENDKSSGI